MSQVVVRAASISITPFLSFHRHFNHFLSPHRLTFLPSPSNPRHAHFKSRGLRLPREPDPVKPTRTPDEDSESEKKRRSRNEMKREARQSVRWGMDLASFSTSQIKLILKAASLEKEVFEALMLVKRLGPDVREGKRRQFNYIGKLLRDAQPELLGELIQATKDGDQSRFQALAGSVKSIDEAAEEEFHESEPEHEVEDSSEHLVLVSKWYDGLINKDIQISNEVYSIDDVEFDRQELRKLVRKVHYVQDRQISSEEDITAEVTSAEKSLNRFLCTLAKRVAESSAQNIVEPQSLAAELSI